MSLLHTEMIRIFGPTSRILKCGEFANSKQQYDRFSRVTSGLNDKLCFSCATFLFMQNKSK